MPTLQAFRLPGAETGEFPAFLAESQFGHVWRHADQAKLP